MRRPARVPWDAPGADGDDGGVVSGAIPPLVLGSRTAFDDRGSHELKGLPDLWPVLAVREGGYAVDVRPVRPRRMVGPNQMGKPM